MQEVDIFRSVDWRDPPGRLPTPNDNLLRQRKAQFHASEVEDSRKPAIRQCRVARFDLRRSLSCQ